MFALLNDHPSYNCKSEINMFKPKHCASIHYSIFRVKSVTKYFAQSESGHPSSHYYAVFFLTQICQRCALSISEKKDPFLFLSFSYSSSGTSLISKHHPSFYQTFLALNSILTRGRNKKERNRHTLMCLSIGTPKNDKFSFCSKWKIHYFKVSQK